MAMAVPTLECSTFQRSILLTLKIFIWFPVVDCQGLLPPENGRLAGVKTTYNSAVNFTCNKGYTLEGSQSRICDANGMWSGNKTTCLGK